MHPEARALKQRYEAMADLFEIPTDVEPFGEERASYLAAVNKQRVSRGLSPLENDEVGHPELTEERRQRAIEFWKEHDEKRTDYNSSRNVRN